VSLGFGLLVSTALTLIALPCFYLIADDMRNWVRTKYFPGAKLSNEQGADGA
jgi:hypothetical protein